MAHLLYTSHPRCGTRGRPDKVDYHDLLAIYSGGGGALLLADEV
jgi:hypothetical protein